jgi:spore coat polysaccharide biosynthesis predicted glycosyltransferase SpsG
MGHINRCSLVAKMLAERFGFKSKLVMKRDALGEPFARSRGLEVLAFDAPTMKEEIEFLQVLAFEDSPALFVLDVLKDDTDAFYMDCVHKFMCPVVAITDDSFQRVIDAELVINANPLQVGQDYSAEKGRYLLGPPYFLMDQTYAKVHTRRPDGNVKKILVTLGASDHNDIVFKLLDALKNVSGDFEVLLIASSASGYLHRLRKFLNGYTRRLDLRVDAPTLVPFWQQADIAITAGGNTLFERIAACVPGATLCQLPRQMEVADKFEAMGLNVNLGFGPTIDSAVLQSGIERFLKDITAHVRHFELAPRVVDGRGLERFGEALDTFFSRV